VPTENYEIESKIQFYQCFNKIMKINTRDIIVVMGDMNAKDGVKNEGL